MDIPNVFKDIAPFLQHPLVLVGFVILLFSGILTALLKAGILPSLPEKTVGDVVKRILNYAFILALLVIILGFWEQMQERSSGTKGPTPRDTTVIRMPPDTSRPVHDTSDHRPPKKKAYCEIRILVPSDLNDAEVLVDGKLANILKRNLISITIRVEKKEIGQRIVLRNNARECSSLIVVDGDKELNPCL